LETAQLSLPLLTPSTTKRSSKLIVLKAPQVVKTPTKWIRDDNLDVRPRQDSLYGAIN
jgi:hypothetical protein